MHVLCIIGTTHQYYIGKKTEQHVLESLGRSYS